MKDEPVAIGPDFQLRAQVSAIIKMNMKIVETNAWIIREIMTPPVLIQGKQDGVSAIPDLTQKEEGEQQ